MLRLPLEVRLCYVSDLVSSFSCQDTADEFIVGHIFDVTNRWVSVGGGEGAELLWPLSVF